MPWYSFNSKTVISGQWVKPYFLHTKINQISWNKVLQPNLLYHTKNMWSYKSAQKINLKFDQTFYTIPSEWYPLTLLNVQQIVQTHYLAMHIFYIKKS